MTRYKFRDTARAAAVVATNAPARRTVVDVISESVGAGTSHPRLARSPTIRNVVRRRPTERLPCSPERPWRGLAISGSEIPIW